MMKKIAFLVHQYGDDIVGGAEGYTKSLAEHLTDRYDVSIFTTTSVDYITWTGHYPDGETIINDVKVIRFTVEKERDINQFSNICNSMVAKLNSGYSTTNVEDTQWLDSEGPYVPNMVSYIEQHKDEYDVFIVVTYIYYIAAKIIPIIADKTLFIPTAHDEPWINLSTFRNIFHLPRHMGFLTYEESELVHNKFNNGYIPYEILGTGIEVPVVIDSDSFRNKFNIIGDYIIYVGRIDASKGCDAMIKNFIKFKKKYNVELKLVLIGKGQMEVPENNDIILTGYVTEDEKYNGIAGALAMVTPSPYESLCIALLEGLALGVPILANAQCDVLKGHCIKSNAGLYYENEKEFVNALYYLYSHPDEIKIMSGNGKNYVDSNYLWHIVKKKVSSIIENICYKQSDEYAEISPEEIKKMKILVDENTLINTINSNAITIVTAADNNYSDFAGITINSIMKNSSEFDYYDVIILTHDTSDDNIKKILSLKKIYKNLSIRFAFVNGLVDELTINISNNYKVVTYYRLLLQVIMRDYSKVIYLDSDIIVNCDISELWNIDIEGYLIGGTYDSLIAAWQNYDSGMQAYFEALEVNNPGKYVQAGVLLFNIEEMKKTFNDYYLIQKACEDRYLFADQDLINLTCQGRIKYIDLNWDVLNLGEEGDNLCINHLPDNLKAEYVNAKKNPKIIHFTEQSFPCWKYDRAFGDIYWKYALQTVFYNELLDKKNEFLVKRNLEKQKDNITQTIEKMPGDLKRNVKNRLMSSKMGRRIIGKIKKQTVDFHEYVALKVNDKLVTSNEIFLDKNMTLSGPNVFLGKGQHSLFLDIKSKSKTIQSRLQIVAGARHIALKEIVIKNGKHYYEFELLRNYADVEIVLKNEDLNVLLIYGLNIV